MDVTPRTLILVEPREVLAQLTALVERAPWAHSRGLAVEAIGGSVRDEIARCREREGGAALGVLVRDEATALLALAAGADEASALSVLEPASVGAFLDRTELRARLRQETSRQRNALEQAEKLTSLGTLLAGVGHEINNPLSAILLYLEVARRAAPESTHLFEEIGAAAESIAAIVRDLRLFARSDVDASAELVDVEQLVDQVIRLVRREITQHGLLERDYAPDLPKLVVPRHRVAQVLVNVLVNAAHALGEVERPAHRVRIRARADHDFVAIVIADTGPGIAPDQLERIFDPFYTTKHASLGTGLGLSISRSILRSLGGDLSVESVYGEGTTFTCLLPRPSKEALRKATLVPAPARSAFGQRASASILVIDDDERMLRSYSRLFDTQHRLFAARDVGEAIALLETGSQPDVLLLELGLPGEDGRALIRWVEEQRPQLLKRVLVVTSAASSLRFVEFLATYRAPVLHKPVRGDELLAAIEVLLGDGSVASS